ncbi:MAG: hypothetical protein Q9160_005092 [Pyrenula sp. 1 TL-2023]
MPLKAVPAELQLEFFMYECLIHSKNLLVGVVEVWSDFIIDYAAVAQDLHATEAEVIEWYNKVEQLFSQFDARTFHAAFEQRQSARNARNRKVPVTPKKTLESFDATDDRSMINPETPKQKRIISVKRGIKRNSTSSNLFPPASGRKSTEIIDLCSDNEFPTPKKLKASNHQTHDFEPTPPCIPVKTGNYQPPSCEPGSPFP